MSTSKTEKQIEDIAKVCHEANRAYCASLGDTSHEPWDKAPEWQKKSAIEGVKFKLLNPHAGPDASHASWARQKLADGWVYGPKKDPDAKPPTHPCLVQFVELPKEQQMKDHLFLGIVKALGW